MKIAVIGKGRVGKALAPRWAEAGHAVVYGVRDPSDARYVGGDAVALMETGAAARWADAIVLSIMWEGVDEALAAMGDISGKILIDVINPHDFAGGLTLLIDGNTSAGELIQARTKATVVKTLNQVSSVVMDLAKSFPERPIQFVAADDEAAKATVIQLIDDLGFRGIDAGPLSYARELEAMGKLWIAQAFQHGMAPETGWYLK